MKHALLVEVPEWDAVEGLRPAATAATMAGLLAELGGWSIVELEGSATTREGVLAALDGLLGTCGPNDTCLFHFFGHGGMARFPALGGELGDRELFYLATLRAPDAPRVGVLDFEVSERLTRLDAICGNVTAIIDCCHSGSVVRSGPSDEPPAWLSALARTEGERTHLLAAESHPRIVRLSGASSLRTAYARSGPEGLCGLVTRGFVDVVREAGLRCDRLTWDAVAHRIREGASRERGMEEQRVVLAGPRHRLVFSTTTVALPRSAAYVPRSEVPSEPTRGESPPVDRGQGRGWLRAGALQGVRAGDRWSIAALTLDDALEPRFVADLRLENVELDRTEVSVSSATPVELPVGATALLRETEERMRVAVEGGTAVASAIEASGWLGCAPLDATGVARIVARPSELVLLDPDGGPSFHASADAVRELVELLEDRARAARLLAAIEAAAPSAAPDVPLRLRWGWFGPDGRAIASTSASSPGSLPRLHVGDRMWLELVHAGTHPPHWFASVIELGADGRPRLLNAREPEGLELEPGSSVRIGLRGQRGRDGLQLVWPAGVPEQGPRPMRLLVLASHRPLPLGHLVRIADPDDDAAFVAQDLPQQLRGRSRGGGPPAPTVSRGWTWMKAELELDPQPRPASEPAAFTLRSTA